MAQRKSRSDRRIDLIEAARRAIIRHGIDGVQLSHVAEESTA